MERIHGGSDIQGTIPGATKTPGKGTGTNQSNALEQGIHHKGAAYNPGSMDTPKQLVAPEGEWAFGSTRARPVGQRYRALP